MSEIVVYVMVAGRQSEDAVALTAGIHIHVIYSRDLGSLVGG